MSMATQRVTHGNWQQRTRKPECYGKIPDARGPISSLRIELRSQDMISIDYLDFGNICRFDPSGQLVLPLKDGHHCVTIIGRNLRELFLAFDSKRLDWVREVSQTPPFTDLDWPENEPLVETIQIDEI